MQFRGSPTVLVDGWDPFLDPASPVGLSCRVYRTEDGVTGAHRRPADRSTPMRLAALRRRSPTGKTVTCGCCARDLPLTAVHELGATPGVYLCRRCALWVAAKIGRG